MNFKITTSAATPGISRMRKTLKPVVAETTSQQSIYLMLVAKSSEIPSSIAQPISLAWRIWSVLLFGNKAFNLVSRSMWSYDLLGMRMNTHQIPNHVSALITLLWSSEVARLSREAEPCRWKWRKGVNCFLICSWPCATISMTSWKSGRFLFLRVLMTDKFPYCRCVCLYVTRRLLLMTL